MLLSGCRSAYGGFAPRKKKRAKSCRVVGVRSVAKEDDATMRPRDSGSVIGALAVQDGAIFACKGHGLLSHKDGVTKEVLKDGGTRENHGHTCQTCLDVFPQVSLSSQVESTSATRGRCFKNPASKLRMSQALPKKEVSLLVRSVHFEVSLWKGIV